MVSTAEISYGLRAALGLFALGGPVGCVFVDALSMKATTAPRDDFPLKAHVTKEDVGGFVTRALVALGGTGGALTDKWTFQDVEVVPLRGSGCEKLSSRGLELKLRENSEYRTPIIQNSSQQPPTGEDDRLLIRTLSFGNTKLDVRGVWVRVQDVRKFVVYDAKLRNHAPLPDELKQDFEAATRQNYAQLLAFTHKDDYVAPASMLQGCANAVYPAFAAKKITEWAGKFGNGLVNGVKAGRASCRNTVNSIATSRAVTAVKDTWKKLEDYADESRASQLARMKTEEQAKRSRTSRHGEVRPVDMRALKRAQEDYFASDPN